MIYLPTTAKPEDSPTKDQILLGAVAGTETILLAEDEEGVRTLARLALESRGYLVLEARNGAEALAVAKQHEGPIHLLITDVVMPRMGGRELMERLANLRPNVPVLFISGYTGDAAFQYGCLETGIPLIHKPFSMALLLRRIRELLDAKQKALEALPA
jgi:two-component system, cell cycle sensor histidine kinase and response regulator CckA